ncbi:ABC transporter permease [Facklamia miroungae]|uniref:ABC-2 family transporter protein n=1 Tax=Facklamia miroungae TaxID=120956 RepID=A0A1G7UZ52_9LACT|nr:ABC transporter permease [Facklamia miroungae]NKZ30205.1 ABC transporter permease [Facklamia miroungae]SDG52767.1 ABC-2 family transporter protein [Facklamia miroungae]
MLKRIWIIFNRDLKVNAKDALSLYILLIPFLLGLAINLFSPGITDTSIRFALIEGENQDHVEYFQQFAKVELFKNEEDIIKRVEKRDAIIGVIPEKGNYYLMTQGNEPEEIIDFAKLLKSFYERGVSIENSNVKLVELDRKVPPLKKTMVNLSILMISILGGMLIALNIIEEKTDKTLSAIFLTPTKPSSYILGKSLIGVFLSIFGSIILVVITDFGGINLLQLVVVTLITSLLSIIIGFIEGLTNDDVIGAASSIKLLFLPLIAAVIATELLSQKWQKFFYWDPFYWAYKANDLILSQTGSWRRVWLYSGLVLLICGGIYIILAPQIKKRLH